LATVTFEGVGKVYPDGTRALTDLNLQVEDGEFMILVGPSGCGKTTALRMIAGLEEITEGELKIDGKVVNTVEPRKRDVAMVFQNYALYPHMTVFDNIAFPLRTKSMSKAEIRERVERTANMLGLGDMIKRRPRTLSGGQRQRVAMGRAVVREPRVFLMDEPLSNLDAKLRVQMRAEIAKLQRELGVTTVYVTHDQIEAMTMGTRLAVMRKGVLQQQGKPQEIYDRPTNLFVASFIGSPAMNLFSAKIEQGANGGLSCAVGDQHLPVPSSVRGFEGLRAYVGRDLAAGIRVEHLTEDGDGAESRLHGEVILVETLGAERLVHVQIAAEPVLTDDVLEVARDTDASVAQSLEEEAREGRVPLVARFSTQSTLEPGAVVDVAVSTKHLQFFDLDTGAAIDAVVA
jgi:multiple sugar transport system ATP-binding protein